MKDFTGAKISVLGDSISTFKGVTRDDPNTFYGRVMCEKGGFAGVQDSWWARVIAALGGEVEKINAYSGSCVADGYGLGRGACTPERIGNLGSPDVILIFMGANDMGFSVPEDAFRASYRKLMAGLKQTHPRAEVFCATLINGIKVLDDEPFFMGEDPTAPLEPFSTIIRECAAEAGAKVVDLAASGVLYPAIDGAHPTAAGMEVLADLWVKGIREACAGA